MRRYDKAYAASHRGERREAARRWQARFKAEHGIDYSAWRRRRLRETDPQTAASTPQTTTPARNAGENGQATADNSIRSLTSSPRLKPGDSLHSPDSKGTSGLWERG